MRQKWTPARHRATGFCQDWFLSSILEREVSMGPTAAKAFFAPSHAAICRPSVQCSRLYFRPNSSAMRTAV